MSKIITHTTNYQLLEADDIIKETDFFSINDGKIMNEILRQATGMKVGQFSTHTNFTFWRHINSKVSDIKEE